MVDDEGAIAGKNVGICPVVQTSDALSLPAVAEGKGLHKEEFR